MEQKLGAETTPSSTTSNEAITDLAHSISVSKDGKAPAASVPSFLQLVVELPSEESKPLLNTPPLELGENGCVAMAVAGSSDEVGVAMKEEPFADGDGERSSVAKTRKEGKRRYRLKTMSMRSSGAGKSEPQDKKAEKSSINDMVRVLRFKIRSGGNLSIY